MVEKAIFTLTFLTFFYKFSAFFCIPLCYENHCFGSPEPGCQWRIFKSTFLSSVDLPDSKNIGLPSRHLNLLISTFVMGVTRQQQRGKHCKKQRDSLSYALKHRTAFFHFSLSLWLPHTYAFLGLSQHRLTFEMALK